MQLPGWALLGLAQRLPSSGAQPGLAGSQGAPARSTPGPGSPSATFVWEPPGQREGAQQRSACVQTLPAFTAAAGPGAAWGRGLPLPGQQNRHSGQRAGGCPGPTWAARMGGRWDRAGRTRLCPPGWG